MSIVATQKRFYNFTCVKSWVEWNDLNSFYWNLLTDYGVNVDDFWRIDEAEHSTACDEYLFRVPNSNKIRHIGLYGGKIEYDYK